MLVPLSFDRTDALVAHPCQQPQQPSSPQIAGFNRRSQQQQQPRSASHDEHPHPGVHRQARPPEEGGGCAERVRVGQAGRPAGVHGERCWSLECCSAVQCCCIVLLSDPLAAPTGSIRACGSRRDQIQPPLDASHGRSCLPGRHRGGGEVQKPRSSTHTHAACLRDCSGAFCSPFVHRPPTPLAPHPLLQSHYEAVKRTRLRDGAALPCGVQGTWTKRGSSSSSRHQQRAARRSSSTAPETLADASAAVATFSLAPNP